MSYFSVTPKTDCPHVAALVQSAAASGGGNDDGDVLSTVVDIQRLQVAFDSPCSGCVAAGLGSGLEENWICLCCTTVFCSRYVAGHMSSHHQSNSLDHTVALSLSDLSVWCFPCDAYIKNELLLSLLVRAEALKFGRSAS